MQGSRPRILKSWKPSARGNENINSPWGEAFHSWFQGLQWRIWPGPSKAKQLHEWKVQDIYLQPVHLFICPWINFQTSLHHLQKSYTIFKQIQGTLSVSYCKKASNKHSGKDAGTSPSFPANSSLVRGKTTYNQKVKEPKSGFQKFNSRNWLKPEKVVPSFWLCCSRQSLIYFFYVIGNSQPSGGQKGDDAWPAYCRVSHSSLELRSGSGSFTSGGGSFTRFTALVYICRLTITCIMKTCLCLYIHVQKYTSFTHEYLHANTFSLNTWVLVLTFNFLII